MYARIPTCDVPTAYAPNALPVRILYVLSVIRYLLYHNNIIIFVIYFLLDFPTYGMGEGLLYRLTNRSSFSGDDNPVWPYIPENVS